MNDYQREYWRRRRQKDLTPAYEALMKYYPLTPDDLSEELWRPVPDFDGYQISNYGRTKRVYKSGKQRILKPMISFQGYLRICLSKSDKKKLSRVHRLVAQAFIPNPEGKPHINHIDGCRFNNHVSNLEWCTRSDNARHAVDTGLMVALKGEDNYQASVTNEQARYIRDNPDNLTTHALAEIFGVAQVTISKIQLGKSYKTAGGTIHQSTFKRVSEDTKAQIRAEYKAGVRGFGCKSLAKKYGLSPCTISNIVKESQS